MVTCTLRGVVLGTFLLACAAAGAEPPVDSPAKPAERPAPAVAPGRKMEREAERKERGLLEMAKAGPRMVEAAASGGRQWTGVAVSRQGRVVVCYPRWDSAYLHAVEEIRSDGSRVAIPDAEWNTWKPGDDPAKHFVCVQSVHVDSADRLWILDAGAPKLGPVVPGAPKLVCVDLATGKVERVIPLGIGAALENSYLNDVRVDVARQTAYITDSGVGAIVVVDLTGGQARRVLEGLPCVRAEPEVVLEIEGRELRLGGSGDAPRVHADGIALSRDGQWLYWQALTGRTLYRAPAAALRDATLEGARLAAMVENLGQTVATDGMEIDERGHLYFTALELGAIVCRTPDGHLVRLTGAGRDDDALAWPDTLAWGPDGSLYITTSQIHRTRAFRSDGGMPTDPYRLVKLEWARPAAGNGDRTIVLEVKGMMCELCEGKVVAAVKKLDGVKDAKASHTDGRVTVTLKPGAKVTAAKLVEVVQGLEYQAKELPAVGGK